MSYDATFSKGGIEWAVELRDGMMHTYREGEWVGGTFVGSLSAVPASSVIEPDPEPEIESVEAL